MRALEGAERARSIFQGGSQTRQPPTPIALEHPEIRRAVAWGIDLFLFWFIDFWLERMIPQWGVGTKNPYLNYFIFNAPMFLYLTVMESSRWQASLGKIVVGLHVGTLQWGRVVPGLALRRALLAMFLWKSAIFLWLALVESLPKLQAELQVPFDLRLWVCLGLGGCLFVADARLRAGQRRLSLLTVGPWIVDYRTGTRVYAADFPALGAVALKSAEETWRQKERG